MDEQRQTFGHFMFIYMTNERTWRSSGQMTMGLSIC